MDSSFRLYLSCLILIVSTAPLVAQVTFDPPTQAPIFNTIFTEEEIEIDGLLNEGIWNTAPSISDFRQFEPIQGDSVSMPTEAKILYDKTYLYIGAICSTPEGKSDVRAQNLQRDFDYFQNDLFGISIDGFMDRRNAISFQTNPYGAQREILVMDGTIFNREWSGLWKVRTHISEDGWTAEMAIPWKTLRYPANCKEIGIILSRNIRSRNEFVSYPPIPRAFNVYRMPYEAILAGISPPPPSVNVQVNPYALVNFVSEKEEGDVIEDNTEFKAGGEIKWVTGPNSVLDFTYNTDFAQADVDRQVVNLSRFSVLFPERRQFFLESNELYYMAAWDFLQPYFSRRIGLDDTGNPIPIEGGARFSSRSPKQSVGALAIRQQAHGGTPAANFAVARYSRNISDQNRLGGMATFRHDESTSTQESILNTTLTLDGFFRPTQEINAFWMLSGSKTTGEISDEGLSGAIWAYYSNNWIYLGHVQSFISEEYNPRVGFIDANNYVVTSPAVEFRLRPKWLPSFIREYNPGITTYFYHYYDDLSFREGFVSYSQGAQFQNGSEFSYALRTNWQSLRETFNPLDIEISAQRYSYVRHIFRYDGDFSKKWGFSGRYEFGKYFNGQLNTINAALRVAPIPHVVLTSNYERNEIKELGINSESLTAHLVGTELRLALNPRIQLISFYQCNTSSKRSTLNSRFVWEYQPLSYLYLVFNDNRQDQFNPENGITSRYTSQQGIVKLTFMKQF